MRPDDQLARKPNYWAIATAVVLGLLLVTWGTAALIEADTWPFHLVWGGMFILVGILMLIAARLSPERIRTLPGGNPTAPLPTTPSPEARAALDALAGGLVASGLAYLITGRLAAFAAAFAFVMLAGRAIAARRSAA